MRSRFVAVRPPRVGWASYSTEVVQAGELGPVTVRALGETLVVPCEEGARRAAAQGEDVVLMVRPESLRLERVAEAQQALTSSLGQIATSVFYGETVEYEIETKFGSIVCVMSDPKNEDLFEEGQVVRVQIEQDKAWLLTSGETTSA